MLELVIKLRSSGSVMKREIENVVKNVSIEVSVSRNVAIYPKINTHEFISLNAAGFEFDEVIYHSELKHYTLILQFY